MDARSAQDGEHASPATKEHFRIGICCYPTAGGSGVVATELGKHLAERGHSVAFVSYSNPLRLGELPPRVCYHEVDQDSHPLMQQFPHSLTLTAKMVEVARTHRLQILHVHYAIPFAAAAIIARQIAPELGLKVITTLHGTDITLVGCSPSLKPVTQWSIEQSDAVTAVSRYLQDETYRQLPVRQRNRRGPQFHRSGPPRRAGAELHPPEGVGAAGDPDAHLQLPPPQARGRRGPHLRAGPPEDGAPPRAGGRRPGVRKGSGAGRLAGPLGFGPVCGRCRRGMPACWPPRTCFSCPARRKASGS